MCVYRLMPVLTFLSAAMCASAPEMKTVSAVDIPRFMGKWYVIACIPTFIEEDAYNAVESYELAPDGTIRTTFTFNEGGFDGPLKKYTPTGFVRESSSGAAWDMQFIRPFRSEYLVIHLESDYSITVIGRTKRDYVWIMAREPSIPETVYQPLLAMIESRGYDIGRVRRVPQQLQGR